MKILVVSLLRLGDIIQQEPLLRGLREKYPNAEIHVLLNKQFSSIERLLAGVVDRYFTFDRESLQRGLGEAEFNILWSYSQLESLVNQLNGEHYDQIFNFTHNKLSAYLVGAVDCPSKKGLHQDNGRFQGLENRWLRYFNDRFSGTQKSLFHYVELLGNSFEIPVVKGPAYKTAVSADPKKRSKRILFQCLTSDIKKNWGLDNFLQLKQTLEKSLVDYKVQILGASFEREQLTKVFAEEDLLICDLHEAKEHLQNAAVLVTGDTSIKHLAAQLGTAIVEIAIGSSDPAKTAAYTENSRVLHSTVPCAPCNHSQGCSQKSHLCADDIGLDQVFAAVWDQLSGEENRKVSQGRDLERQVWALYLNKGTKQTEPYLTDYMFSAQNFIKQTSNLNEVLAESHKKAQLFSSWLERAEAALPSRESLLAKKAVHSSELAELIMVGQDILRSKQDETGYFQDFLESLVGRFSHPVQIYDRVFEALENVRELMNIRKNLLYNLESQSALQPQRGDYYAAGIGQLSIGGFEEARASLQRTDEQSALQRRGREIETFE